MKPQTRWPVGVVSTCRSWTPMPSVKPCLLKLNRPLQVRVLWRFIMIIRLMSHPNPAVWPEVSNLYVSACVCLYRGKTDSLGSAPPGGKVSNEEPRFVTVPAQGTKKNCCQKIIIRVWNVAKWEETNKSKSCHLSVCLNQYFQGRFQIF